VTCFFSCYVGRADGVTESAPVGLVWGTVYSGAKIQGYKPRRVRLLWDSYLLNMDFKLPHLKKYGTIFSNTRGSQS
jgi:hypothetical protein